MPQMANITVKKADGTTDVVYTALNPAGGDNTSARWQATALGAAAALRPTCEVRSRDNGNKDARVVQMQYTYRDVRVVDGVDTIVGTIPMTISATVPKHILDTVIAEAVHQGGNLFVSVLMREAFKTGYAPQ